VVLVLHSVWDGPHMPYMRQSQAMIVEATMGRCVGNEAAWSFCLHSLVVPSISCGALITTPPEHMNGTEHT